jgi:hypothetical protein
VIQSQVAPPESAADDADLAQACSWYQKEAEGAEADALARLAERDEGDAIAEADPLEERCASNLRAKG